MGAKRLARNVSIIGASYSHMGIQAVTPEQKDFTERELFAEACIGAMEDAGVEPKDIDAYLVGHCAPNFFAKATSSGPHYGDWIGMHNKPCWFHDEACSTSIFGLEMAALMVASGQYDCIITAGVGINSTVPLPARPPYLRKQLDGDMFWEGMYYAVEPAYDKPGNAGVGNSEAAIVNYLKHYGYSFKDYDDAMIGYLKSKRRDALLNPKAHLFPMTFEEEAKSAGFDNVDDYLKSPIYNPHVGTVLRGKYLGSSCDGASAIIVCADDIAKKITNRKPIHITGLAAGTNVVRDWAEMPISAVADTIQSAIRMSSIADPSKEIDFMAVHDCTGGPIFQNAEYAGYYGPGEGIKLAMEGELGFDGKKPMNTSGGRMQLGHPSAGAVGIEITEAVRQMRGENGARQMSRIPRKTLVTGEGAGFSTAAVVLENA